jgi:YggT family protein
VKTAATIVYALAQLYLLVLLARVVISCVMAFSRSWRPQKMTAAVAELVFAATDPPVRLARKVIKPVRVGSVALDLALAVVMIVVLAVAYLAAIVIGA